MVRGRRVLCTTAHARVFRPVRRGSAARWGTREAPVAGCTASRAIAAAQALAAARRGAPHAAGGGPGGRAGPQLAEADPGGRAAPDPRLAAAARPAAVALLAVAPWPEPAAPSRRRLG